MLPDEVLQTYGPDYAASYDAKFIGPGSVWDMKTLFERGILTSLIQDRPDSWLDVACGTGYWLSEYVLQQNRYGFDLSPHMVEVARTRYREPWENPPAFWVADFLDPNAFTGRAGLVTCMWYAYFLQETLDDVARVIENFGRWTAPGGVCFAPALDPAMLVRRQLFLTPGMTLDEPDGTAWSFAEPDGYVHRRILAPPVGWLAGEFHKHFGTVEVTPYPTVTHSNAVAIVARKI